MRDVLGLPWLTFNIFSMPGLVLVTVMHTFPFVYLLASSALQSVDASYEEAAQILGASKLRTAFSITAPLVAPAVLSGTLLAFVNAHRAVRLAGDHRAARPHRHAADAHLCAVRLSAGIRARLRAVAGVHRDHGRGALSAARVPRAALLRDARRQGLAPADDAARRVPLGAVRLRACWCSSSRSSLPYATLIAVSFSKILGPRILEEPHARQLQVHPVRIQRHPARDLQQPAAGDRGGDVRGAARRGHRLDRPAHPHSGPQAPRLCLADPARAARHRDGGGADPVLAGDAGRALRHADDPAARLCRPLHSARRARRQRLAAPGRSIAGGERANPRRQLGHDHARDHAAADPARPVRRLAPGVRAGDPGAVGLDPAVLVELDHARGRGLQSLRDRLYRAGGGARHDQHGDHRRWRSGSPIGSAAAVSLHRAPTPRRCST